jgi:hypothetical protein
MADAAVRRIHRGLGENLDANSAVVFFNIVS